MSPTGDSGVDEVLQRLVSVPELDESAQQEVYEQLHDDLLAQLNTEHG